MTLNLKKEKRTEVETYQNYLVYKKSAEKRKGFRIHRNIYFCVITLLATINMVFVPGFIWFVFPMVGWGSSLMLHYYLAIVKGL